MSQLSRPYQIALGVLLVFALAWFVVLKPSDAAEPPPVAPSAEALPGASGLTKAVDKAEGAAATANASARSASASTEDGAGETTTAAKAAAAPAAAGTDAAKTNAAKADAAPDDPSAAILDEVADGKVAVVLFFSPTSSDDKAVRAALKGADRHGGEVVVHAAPIADVGDYTAITKGVDILQAPTLLVIGEDRKARPLVGFTDTRSIDQLVDDVRRTNAAE